MPILTNEEKQSLAKAITTAASGLAECVRVLNAIGERIGAEWDPKETSVSDMVDELVRDNFGELHPDAIAAGALDPDALTAVFAEEANWKVRD
jgi:hypothetical protein